VLEEPCCTPKKLTWREAFIWYSFQANKAMQIFLIAIARLPANKVEQQLLVEVQLDQFLLKLLPSIPRKSHKDVSVSETS